MEEVKRGNEGEGRGDKVKKRAGEAEERRIGRWSEWVGGEEGERGTEERKEKEMESKERRISIGEAAGEGKTER